MLERYIMGHYGRGLARGEPGDYSRVTVLIVLLISLGRAQCHAFELGNWFTDAVVAASTDPHQPVEVAVPVGDSITDLEERVLAEDELSRRMLSAYSPFYIGYGVLTAGYTPCPPRSGRSYYTPNCHSASGAARPYRRGCSVISRCARG